MTVIWEALYLSLGPLIMILNVRVVDIQNSLGALVLYKHKNTVFPKKDARFSKLKNKIYSVMTRQDDGKGLF